MLGATPYPTGLARVGSISQIGSVPIVLAAHWIPQWAPQDSERRGLVLHLHTGGSRSQACAVALPILKEEPRRKRPFIPREARTHEKSPGRTDDLVCTQCSSASAGCTASPAARVHGRVHAGAPKRGLAAARGGSARKRDRAGDSAWRCDVFSARVQRRF